MRAIFLAAMIGVGSQIAGPSASAVDVEAMATAAAQGVGVIRVAHPGDGRHPIFVLEERHDSTRGQLEEAVMLDRLWSSASLRDIVLEGFLRDSSAIHGASVAPEEGVRLVKNGDIGCAEFMQMTRGTVLHPAEKSNEYVQPDEDTSAAPTMLLVTIALADFQTKAQQNALDEAMVNRIGALDRKLKTLSGTEKAAEIAKFQFSLVEWDPWTKHASDQLSSKCGPQLETSITDQIAVAKGLSAKAKAVNAQSDPKIDAAMQKFLRFLEARDAASDTMVSTAVQVADTVQGPVALIIGAAHAPKVQSLLTNQQRSFAVLAPTALASCDEHGNVDSDRYARLVAGKPLESGFLEDALTAAYPPAHVRPQPLSQQPWFQARLELSELSESFARAALQQSAKVEPGDRSSGGGDSGSGGGGGGPPRGAAPFPLDPDRWRGKYVRIDTASVVPVKDKKTNNPGVVFAAVLNPDDPSRSRTVWIRAMAPPTQASDIKPAKETDVQKLLLDAINRIQRHDDDPTRPDEEKVHEHPDNPERTQEKAQERVLRETADLNISAFASKEDAMKGVSRAV